MSTPPVIAVDTQRLLSDVVTDRKDWGDSLFTLEDETEAAESFVLPGADLSAEVLDDTGILSGPLVRQIVFSPARRFG